MISLLIFIAANILLAALPANLAALFILRIVQGFDAASVLSLGAGTVADITEPKKRASAMSIVLLGPQFGPVLGPLLGGAITGGASWRWTFGFLGMSFRSLLYIISSISMKSHASHYLLRGIRRPSVLSPRDLAVHRRKWRHLHKLWLDH